VTRLMWFACLLLAAACADGPPRPASLQSGVPCARCRMTVLDRTLAAQIAAPGEEPRFFDDIGCLSGYLKDYGAPADARAYVADHSTGAWIDAAEAVYSRSESIPTPMDSHIIAYANDAARGADAGAKTARALSVEDVFGPAGPYGGRRVR
jgi:copper chaperone NosL